MKKTLSIAGIVAVLTWSAFAGGASAQVYGPTVLDQGTVQSVDLQTKSIVLSSPQGTRQYLATSLTAAYVGTNRLSGLQDLQHFVGAHVSVLGTSFEDQHVAGRVVARAYSVAGAQFGSVTPAHSGFSGVSATSRGHSGTFAGELLGCAVLAS